MEYCCAKTPGGTFFFTVVTYKRRKFLCAPEYIHYNPVKHGLVKALIDWAYSSFLRYVQMDKYPADWGTGRVITFPPEIGRE